MFDSTGGGIHPSAIVGHPPEHREWTPDQPTHEVELGGGVRIHAYVTVDAGMNEPTRIGARSWLMKHVHVGHDAQIGEDCELSPGVIVGGHVVIGDGVRVGIGAMFRPGVKVGNGARIGCGAIVVTDVPAREVWVGNPARYLREVRPGIDTPDLQTLTGA